MQIIEYYRLIIVSLDFGACKPGYILCCVISLNFGWCNVLGLCWPLFCS